MTTNAARKIFVNLPVADLQRSIAFFTRLGFTFNPQFTDDTAACMVVNSDAYFMLLSHKRFADFALKPRSDAAATTSAIYAVSVNSRAEVDEVVKAALEGGGKPASGQEDLGFMYSWSFYDLDDRPWNVLYMEPAHVQPTPEK